MVPGPHAGRGRQGRAQQGPVGKESWEPSSGVGSTISVPRNYGSARRGTAPTLKGLLVLWRKRQENVRSLHVVLITEDPIKNTESGTCIKE